MGEGDVYFRCHLEVGRSENGHEVETHGGPARAPGGDEDYLGKNTGREEREGE